VTPAGQRLTHAVKSLYLRIYLTVVAALALFALVSGWLVQRHLEQERVRFEERVRDRTEAWADLLQRSLPGPGAAGRAGRGAAGLVAAPAPAAGAGRCAGPAGRHLRTFAAARPRRPDAGAPAAARAAGRRPHAVGAAAAGMRAGMGMRPGMMPGAGRPRRRRTGALAAAARLARGVTLAVLLLVLFAAVAGGAWPVVRRLTRRLEALKQGVEAFGAGALHQRVAEDGRDEVAALGASFNRAAARIEALLQSHKSLLANASHELRSPLTRLKMAVSMLEDATPAQRAAMRREIDVNIAELDALVEEVLLASRLDAGATLERRDEVDLLGLAAEEAARVDASVQGDAVISCAATSG
jgi:signal transduction histidine kinase